MFGGEEGREMRESVSCWFTRRRQILKNNLLLYPYNFKFQNIGRGILIIIDEMF